VQYDLLINNGHIVTLDPVLGHGCRRRRGGATESRPGEPRRGRAISQSDPPSLHAR